MKVFVTGANGFIGLPTLRVLVNRGHQVLALARSDASAEKITSTFPTQKAITIVRGSTEDFNLITTTSAEADGVIHLAYNHDFKGTDRVTAAKQDDAVLDALLAGLRRDGVEKHLVVAGGCSRLQPASLLKPGYATLSPLKEDDKFETGNARIETNEKVVHSHSIRGTVMRLAPTVHGKSDPNFITFLRDAIVKNQRAAYLGDGSNRWPATHVNDAAAALVLAVEKGHRGYLHPIAEEGVALKDVVQAVANRVGLQAESVDAEEFQKLYGYLDPVLKEDRPVNGLKTQEILGWTPKGIGLIQDIRENY